MKQTNRDISFWEISKQTVVATHKNFFKFEVSTQVVQHLEL